MADKRMSMKEAAALVPGRDASLAFGGVTLYRRPMAFSLALLQRFRSTGSPSSMTLLSFTSGVEGDLLVGEGMIGRTRTCYFGLEIFGLAPHFTRSAAKGGLEIVEETEASLAYGLRAAMAGVGFMPSRAWIGTDLPRLRPDVRTVTDPYTGQELIAFPAIECDVAVIHALKADPAGNAQIGGNRGVDPEISLVAQTVIVTAEQVVPALDRADVLAPVVSAVVEAPKGAWPTSCHPCYPFDGNALLEYTETVGTAAYSGLIDRWLAFHGLNG
jgi:glutaconate CoA-transferase, subunit A